MELVKTVVPLVVRWGLKFAAGFLTINGISQSAAEEVAIGLVLALVGMAMSLLQRKKDLATPPPNG